MSKERTGEQERADVVAFLRMTQEHAHLLHEKLAEQGIPKRTADWLVEHERRAHGMLVELFESGEHEGCATAGMS